MALDASIKQEIDAAGVGTLAHRASQEEETMNHFTTLAFLARAHS
jgi:hypothetical protein